MKKVDKRANSSGVLSFAILHANTEIRVTNSQFCIIIKTPFVHYMFSLKLSLSINVNKKVILNN